MIGPNALLSIPGRVPGEETFPKGTCQKGDACEYAHGVFESWLHPSQGGCL
jgi:hypothetical protein